jgi:phospholipid/cholesterol/gamma-HCH transport system substrate-binding protein
VTLAIRKHLRDFAAILVLAAIAIGCLAYILNEQRFRIPLLEEPPFELEAELANAQGVMPGQGQTIRVAGMRVGDLGEVTLENGVAVVKLELDPEYDDLVRADATALLRPRTGLKDMFLELDPGTKAEPPLEEGESIPVVNTAPDVNPDEILSVLDDDTRDYLRLLLTGAGGGLERRGSDLREVFRRLGPLHRHLAELNGKLKERRRQLARLVHNSGETFEELATKDKELSRLVVASERVFGALAAEDQNISEAVSRLPTTLAQAEQTLLKVDELGQVMGPAFEALRPAARQLKPTNDAIRPFALEAMPIIRDRIRPFVRTARPYIRNLQPAAENLHKASPDLRGAFYELNRLFNMLANNPGGHEELDTSGTAEAHNANRRRDEGFLFWLAWVAQNTTSIMSTGDAHGNFRRFTVSATCTTLRGLVDTQPALEPLLGLTALLNDPGLCPAS